MIPGYNPATNKIDPQRLGDRVAAAVKPIAQHIKEQTGVDLTKCGGCHAAQRGLNGGGRLDGEQDIPIV